MASRLMQIEYGGSWKHLDDFDTWIQEGEMP